MFNFPGICLNTATMIKVACPALLSLSLLAAAHAQDVKFQRTEDVIYGRKFGTALTLVFSFHQVGLGLSSPATTDVQSGVGQLNGSWTLDFTFQ
ncbi:MAG TPA: hypothetical protein VN673_06110 [Clostridia bacterium]|nr:hypothetical protein [Clostridia bacterium]